MSVIEINILVISRILNSKLLNMQYGLVISVDKQSF